MILLPIQVGQGVTVIFTENFDGPSTSWVIENGNWYISTSEGILYGEGTSGSAWDTYYYEPPFYETDYTITFNAFLEAGFGAEQFYFCFNYDQSDKYRLELGSSVSHIVNSSSPMFTLSYAFPKDKWVPIHIGVSIGEMKLWVNGEQLALDITVIPAPELSRIAFGVSNGTHAHFDDITIYEGYKAPDPVDPSAIFADNYNKPAFSPLDSIYSHIGLGWSIMDLQLFGDWPNTNWSSCRADVFFPLEDVTIEFDYDVHTWYSNTGGFSFRLTSSSHSDGGRFITFFENGSVWYTNTLAGESEHRPDNAKISPLPGKTHVTIVFDLDSAIKVYLDDVLVVEIPSIGYRESGLIGFGLYHAKVAFDNLFIQDGMHPPYKEDPSSDWSVSVGDEFKYTLSEFSANTPDVDIGSWFSPPETPYDTSLFIQEGDELRIVVNGFYEDGIHVDVYINNMFEFTKVTNVFFLPIEAYQNLGETPTWGGLTLAEEPDFYTATMIVKNEETGAIQGEVAYYWLKSNGVLDNIILLSGTIPSSNQEVIDAFFFEITKGSADYWAVSVDDEFTYRITEYSGELPFVDLGRWFSSPDTTDYTPLMLHEGDQLRISVVDISENGIEVDVWLNDNYDRTSYTYFFFLPVNNMANYNFYGGTGLINADNFYIGTLFGKNPDTGAEEGELEFHWSKTTGALEKAELMLSPFPIPETGEYVDIFLLELISESHLGSESDTNPTINLTPGWELLVCLGVLSILPFRKRVLRK
jgi:hypothetical protein